MSSLATPLRAQQRLELLLVDEVATHLVLEVGRPVELDRSLDVALVVGGGVLVDLDEDDLVVVEVVLDPLGGDESVLAAHVVLLVSCCWEWLNVRWSRGGQHAAAEQVDLAAEAQADGGVEEGGHQGEGGRDVADEVGAGREAHEGDRDEDQADALREARRRGVLEVGRGADPRPHDDAEQRRDGRALDAAQHRRREQGGLRGEQQQPDRAGRGEQHRDQHGAGDHRRELLPAWVDLLGHVSPWMSRLTGAHAGGGRRSRREEERLRRGRDRSGHSTQRRAHAAVVHCAALGEHGRGHDGHCRGGQPGRTYALSRHVDASSAIRTS